MTWVGGIGADGVRVPGTGRGESGACDVGSSFQETCW